MRKPQKRLSGRLVTAYVRWKSAAASEHDRMPFQADLRQDPAARAQFAALERLWKELGLFPVELMADAGSGGRRAGPGTALRLPAIRSGWGIAAQVGIAALLLVFVGLLFVRLLDGSGLDTYQTKRGERIVINLADDSVVHLNANTRVSIEMNSEQRKIRLEAGEGLFNVARDETRKFIVHTNIGSIEAIGTRFNVQTSGAKLSVTVLDGVVLVSSASSDRSRHVAQYVEQGQQVVIGENGLIASTAVPDVEAVVSWANSRLVFAGEPLAQVIERVNQHSKRRIEIQDARLRDLPVYGVFIAGDTRGFLAALQQSYPLQSIMHSHDSTYLVYREPIAAGGVEEDRQ